MQTRKESKFTIHQLQYLPSYAAYLLKERLREYVEYQIELSKELELPLLKSLQELSKEQLVAISTETSKEYLSYLVNNKADELIEASLIRWLKNQLPGIDKDDVVADDITLLTFIRRKTFLHFIQDYTRDIDHVIAITQEVNLFLAKSETESTNTYIDLLKGRIREQSFFNERIANTSPAIIYLFNLNSNSVTFINETAEKFFGISKEDFIALGQNALAHFVHPEDLPGTEHILNGIGETKDQDVWSYDYRLKNKKGDYLWMNNTITVFKRDERGLPAEIIGNIINIHKEKETTTQLRQREEQLRKSEDLYKQAQALSHIGHFSLNLRTNELYMTDELKRIYGLATEDNYIPYETIMRLRHADDIAMVDERLQNTINNRVPFDFNYRLVTSKGIEKTVHAIGEISKDYATGDELLIGTIQDLTEHYEILDKLRKSDERHQQAEALTHIGSYLWNLETDEVEWSYEMYRIYGFDPTGHPKVKAASLRAMSHPDDGEMVKREMERAIAAHKPHDFYFRILLKDGNAKVLHARGDVIYKKDKPVFVVGTAQDETEKQALIARLRQSESMYQQAEAMANIGNYVLDLKTNSLDWTDQLYNIYGLEPQSERVTTDRFYSFVHPADLDYVKKCTEELMEHTYTDCSFRIITAKNEVKILRSIARVQQNERGEAIRIIGTEQDITERQNLILRLQESEHLYKQAQSLAQLGNWSIDLHSNKYIWSEEMYNIYELQPGQEFTAEQWASYIHPDEREEVLDYLKKCIAERVNYDKYHRIILPNGKIKTLHRKGELVYNEKGDAIKLIGTTQDVTEQYRIQQELKENQTFIRKIADATPSIISSYNVKTGVYTFISEGLRKLLGYEPEQAKEEGLKFFINIVHPDDLEMLTQKNNEALAAVNRDRDNNDVIEFIYRMRHKSGHYVWFHTYGTVFDRDAQGNVEHVLNISLDVTEQHDAIKKIAEQEQFIKHIADASPTVLYVFDIATNSIAYINREIFFVLGYTRDEILEMGGNVTDELYHPDDIHLLPERKQSTKKIVESDIMLQYECRIKNKEGEWQWFLVREVVFKTDDQGNVLQIVGAALDISRRKEMEKTLLQNSFQLEQSNASLEEFAYVASHDLKEPLRKISTFGDRLAASQAKELTPEGKLYLGKIIDASQRMQTMINDLLSISMISGNKSFEPYSLQAILDETMQTLEFRIDQKGAIIHADPLPMANIVPSQFRQLFQNLLSNSLKFIPDDRQPVITIEHCFLKGDKVAHYQLALSDLYLKLEFKDNGIGFENEFAGKIFAIFQRLHGRSEYEGSGIGLAICKKIVEHHGGVIYANGEPDKGATFTIILPA